MSIEELNAFFQSDNIAESLSDRDLQNIGNRAVDGYDLDRRSRDHWEENNRVIFDLAKQIGRDRYIGKDKISNVRYPILANAAIEFSARAYPNVVKGSNVVKCDIVGSDQSGEKAAKGERVQQHMSYQILNQMDDWEEDMDQLLMSVALVGCIFKKTYFDPVEMKNVSELIHAEDLIVNYYAKSLEKAIRVTHKVYLSPNDIVERIRAGVFLDFDFDAEMSGDVDKEIIDDEDEPHTFLEQHCWLDLDDDGYKEPYILTVHKNSSKVVRITARYAVDGIKLNNEGEITKIIPVHYFTKFQFLPAFDGNFYGMGFGALLTAPINVINTIFNQLLDAGTLANRQGGFLGPGVNLKKGKATGPLLFKQGEWKQISYLGDDIRKAVFALPVREPSNVLFQLLGLMLDAAKQLSSQAEVLSGEQSKANVPATSTLALIEQGLKVFSAIYLRLYRSLKKEFKKIRTLNQLYLSDRQYNTIIDSVKIDERGQPIPFVAKEDYSDESMDIIPVSGSADISDTQRIIKAQALLELRNQGLNDYEINKRYLEALQIPDPNALLPDPNQPPPPDPKLELEKEKLRLKMLELQLDAKRQMAEEREKSAKNLRAWSESIKNLAQAEAAEAGPQLDQYKAEIKEATERMKSMDQLMGQIGGQENKQQGGAGDSGGV